MSAETLRRAANLMRDRAELAPDGPWFRLRRGRINTVLSRIGSVIPEIPDGQDALTTTHVASWHPAVALAVADWLDLVAVDGDNGYDESDDNYRAAMNVARVYLQESA